MLKYIFRKGTLNYSHTKKTISNNAAPPINFVILLPLEQPANPSVAAAAASTLDSVAATADIDDPAAEEPMVPVGRKQRGCRGR